MSEGEALDRYVEGKERLQVLLEQRDGLLAGFETYSWVPGLSTTQFVVDLDLAGLRQLIGSLERVSWDIEEAVSEINRAARQCGQSKVGMKVARRLDPGALRLSRHPSELGAPGE